MKLLSTFRNSTIEIDVPLQAQIGVPSGPTLDPLSGPAGLTVTGAGATGSSIWYWGDGYTSTGADVTHTYKYGGTFTVTVDATTFTVEVAAPIIGTTSGTMFYPLAKLDYRQFADLTMRQIQSTWPTQVYDNGAYPVRELSFWPVPQNPYAVELWLWEPLATYASLDDELNLPPGYERYLILKLAMEVAPEFGKTVTETLKATLREAENVVKTLNQQQGRMNASHAGYAVSGRRPSWMTGASVPYSITQV